MPPCPRSQDDDTLINLPLLFDRLPRASAVSPRALFGTIKWGCYSDQRFKWEASYKTWPCGRTAFARSRSPGEAANLSRTYEGPYELALGWFFAMPRGLVDILASCRYAAHFHQRALNARAEPFLRKEDDPLNGFWLYKCLRERGLPPVAPLPPLREGEAHNMACISPRGLYRRPANTSLAVHFLKSVSAMRYVQAVLRWERAGEPRHSRKCCARMVWPTERGRHPPETCQELLSPAELAAEAAVDLDVSVSAGSLPSRGQRGRRKKGPRGARGNHGAAPPPQQQREMQRLGSRSP